MKKIFEKIFRTRRTRIISPSSINNDETTKKSYISWSTSARCLPEYDMGSDSSIGGCGSLQEVSEYDIHVKGEIYTWFCKNCGMCHGIYEGFIPEQVKHRIKNRSSHYNSKVVSFEDYKNTRC